MSDTKNNSLGTIAIGSLAQWLNGSMAGQFVVPDDFDEPLDDELLDLFEGKDDVKLTDKGS